MPYTPGIFVALLNPCIAPDARQLKFSPRIPPYQNIKWHLRLCLPFFTGKQPQLSIQNVTVITYWSTYWYCILLFPHRYWNGFVLHADSTNQGNNQKKG